MTSSLLLRNEDTSFSHYSVSDDHFQRNVINLVERMTYIVNIRTSYRRGVLSDVMGSTQVPRLCLSLEGLFGSTEGRGGILIKGRGREMRYFN